MNFSNKIIDAKMHGEVVPMKGHAKIILADDLTGKVTDVIESDNRVTEAVQSLLETNYCGMANYQALMPFKSLFNGVMLFQEILDDGVPHSIMPPSDLVNPMIANAGPTAHSSASTYRGNPNGGESQETSNSIKFVWDWATNQGNGRINSVCLCPGVAGNIGLKSFDASMSPLSTFGGSYYNNMSFNENEGIKFPFLEVDEDCHASVWLDGTTFKLKKVEHDYTKFGILRTPNSWRVISTKTATIRAGNNRCVYEDYHAADSKWYFYVIHATSATTLMIDRISGSIYDDDPLVVTQMDITCSDTSFYTGTVASRNGSLPIFAIDHDYLYFPHSNLQNFYKINLYNAADVTLLSGDVTIDFGQGTDGYRNGEQFANPLVISRGLVLGNTYMINGNSVYPLKRTASIGTNIDYAAYKNAVWIAQGFDWNGCYGHCRQTYNDGYNNGQVNVLMPFFLSTINDLEDEITKSPSKTMKVEYTLMEA